jgi:hypothetical protein
MSSSYKMYALAAALAGYSKLQLSICNGFAYYE